MVIFRFGLLCLSPYLDSIGIYGLLLSRAHYNMRVKTGSKDAITFIKAPIFVILKETYLVQKKSQIKKRTVRKQFQ